MSKKKPAKAKQTYTDLNSLKDTIEKEFGSGSIMLGRSSIVNVDVFSTGVASIDMALGCGGLPQGRIIELYGPESGGKTTTCLQFIAACQKHNFENKGRTGVAAFIDAEHALDPEWAEKVGVDMDRLILAQPDSGEQALTIAERFIDSGLIDLIVIDSVAALIPKAVLDGEVGDSTMAALAQLMSKGTGRLKGKCNATKTTVIFINQIREKVGVMFGSPEVTPGGRALKFYASVRAEVRKGQPIKDGDVVVGFRPTIKMVKNKVAAPFRVGEYDICVGTPQRPICGIDTIASLFDVAVAQQLVTRKGSFFTYGDASLGNGTANAVKTLRESERWVNEIKSKIYSGIASNLVTVADIDDTDSFDESDESDEFDDSSSNLADETTISED